MKRWVSFSICALIVAVFLCQGVWAAESASRPATKRDLVGTWQLVSVRPVHDKNDPTFFPYQRFQFNGDASMKYISSEKPLTKEWLEKFAKQQPEIDYSVNQKGLLTLTWQKIDHSESAVCSYVLLDVPKEVAAKLPADRRQGLPAKGNITLSFLNKSGRIAYQKVLARVG